MSAQLYHPSLIHCRRLFLHDYEININIGVHDYEKTAEQRVILNIDLYIPLEINTPKHDLLEEVVDYDFIRETIRKRVSAGHIHLQETLCDYLARALLLNSKVSAVLIRSEKPDVYPDCFSVGTEVFQIKDDF